jgi:DNA-binding NtrC family response regulator
LEEVERQHILQALERCQWNRTHAAAKLGISIRTLRNKLREYRMTNADDREEQKAA